MKYDKLSRRFFLQGLGGSLMTLPILPSLLTKAEAASLPSEKFLILLGTGHGGTGYTSDWYPAPVLDNAMAPMLKTHQLFGVGGENSTDYIIRHGRLTEMLTADPAHPSKITDNGKARLSFILGSHMTPFLSKMNFLRGIDRGTFYSGHHRAMFTGNIKEAVNNSTAREAMEAWPSLDQFLANSPKFYTNPELHSVKSVILSIDSYQMDGTPAAVTAKRVDALYTSIFSKYEDSKDPVVAAQKARRKFLIDKVFEDYKNLVSGAYGAGRRISSEDRRKVDQHAQLLRDVQNKYSSLTNSCSDVIAPTNIPTGKTRGDREIIYDMYFDLIIAGFQCGATRLAVADLPLSTGYSGDFHQEVIHQHDNDPAMQTLTNEHHRWIAEKFISNLIGKMDSIPRPDGSTLLDDSLVTWTHECGYQTHQHHSIGLVTFGSLGGGFKTGNYVDYRNLVNNGLKKYRHSSDLPKPGLPIQRFWANILLAMGFSPSDFERHGRPGYSDSSFNTMNTPQQGSGGHIAYTTRVMNSLSDPLPIIR